MDYKPESELTILGFYTKAIVMIIILLICYLRCCLHFPITTATSKQGRTLLYPYTSTPTPQINLLLSLLNLNLNGAGMRFLPCFSVPLSASLSSQILPNFLGKFLQQWIGCIHGPKSLSGCKCKQVGMYHFEFE